MVEVDTLLGGAESATQFSYNRALLVTLVDRWPPEMHTFHLPCDKMSPTLEDVSLLFGLRCIGATVGTRDVGAAWRDMMGCLAASPSFIGGTA